jgi:hypothetical protein
MSVARSVSWRDGADMKAISSLLAVMAIVAELYLRRPERREAANGAGGKRSWSSVTLRPTPTRIEAFYALRYLSPNWNWI